MNRISTILGAGFSYNSGLPLAKGINDFFTRDNRNQLLHFPSDEWKWYDLALNEEQHNGRLSYDWMAYGYILNKMVSEFIKVYDDFNNYEQFYQFLIDGLAKQDFLNKIATEAHAEFDLHEEDLKKEKYFYDLYTEAFLNPQTKQVYNMLNYLISELLYWRKPIGDFSSSYDHFFTFLSKFEHKDYFTLNHDYLLEALLNQKGIEYCDGFSKSNSRLQTRNGKIKCFNGEFLSENVLIKLHGSIDLFKYECAESKGALLIPTGEYIYFKTHDFYEKQNPKRIDLGTDTIIQDYHWNITPQFITGTRKEELIQSDNMYKMLYGQLNERIKLANALLIVGYSYSDNHVNKLIKDALTGNQLNSIINVNPSIKFPFSADKNVNIENKKYIEEL